MRRRDRGCRDQGGFGALAAPAVLRVTPANAQSRSAMSARRPGRSPASAKPTASSSTSARPPGAAIGGKTYPVQIISKDSQSSRTRLGGRGRADLGDKVDLIVAAHTPDTTNPVADQAEVNEVPCITTDCPWQP